MCTIGMKISNVSLSPFPGIWNYFMISLNDNKYCESACGGMNFNRDRTGLLCIFASFWLTPEVALTVTLEITGKAILC
jgi:hypothetical protein